jgi:hypothetical protein
MDEKWIYERGSQDLIMLKEMRAKVAVFIQG